MLLKLFKILVAIHVSEASEINIVAYLAITNMLYVIAIYNQSILGLGLKFGLIPNYTVYINKLSPDANISLNKNFGFFSHFLLQIRHQA